MTRLGLPVPPGFIITTEACRHYLEQGRQPDQLRVQVTMALRHLEDEVGRRLGDSVDPLLVSVRSGAKYSMPGMMETVLNVGLNDHSVAGLVEESGDERFAWDSYRRLIQMFGKTVLGVDGDAFASALDAAKERKGVKTDVELDAADLQKLVDQFKQIVLDHTGRDFPQDPRDQLDLATLSVFDSWNTDRAKLYRRRERIPHDLGTAVNVCTMVFGNLGDDSGTGVCFTRDPATGKSGVYGDYLVNAQGEDVVSGIRNTLSLDDFAQVDKASYDQLRKIMRRLETHYRDLCDIEFTVERGKLWMLQTRVGKRTAAAAFRVATQLVDEQLITMDEALERVTGAQLAQLMFPQFDAGSERTLLTRGMAASPGAAVGRVVFDSTAAVAWQARVSASSWCARRPTPRTSKDDRCQRHPHQPWRQDFARGGRGTRDGQDRRLRSESLEVDADAKQASCRRPRVSEGDVLSIDGSTGEVFVGELPVVPSPGGAVPGGGIDAALADADSDVTEVVRAVDRSAHPRGRVRRMRVRANVDTAGRRRPRAPDGREASGCAAPSTCSLGDRRELIERVILAESTSERQEALRRAAAARRPRTSSSC
jgi:pyruvate,orthophosphate dikinase